MGQEKPSEFKGAYDQLSPHIFEEAALLDQAYDLHAAAQTFDQSAEELREVLRQQGNEEIQALIDATDIHHDEFLRRYQAALLKFNQRTFDVAEFGRMMELRSQLKPGVDLMFNESNITVVTIAEPVDESDVNFGIQPVLKNPNHGREHSFYWLVPVKERDGPISVDRYTLIGKDAIAKNLDERFSSRHNNISFVDLENGALGYERLGESDKAEELRSRAVSGIMSILDNQVFTDDLGSSNRSDLRLNLGVLYRLNQPKYMEYLDRVKEWAADGRYREGVLRIIDVHAGILGQNAAHSSRPAPADLARLYSEFIQEGEVILAAREAEAATKQ